MNARGELVAAFERALARCDPEAIVRDAITQDQISPPHMLGLSMGKAALGMARGAGPVVRGVIATPHDDGRGVPTGWTIHVGSHPEPDERSVEAADAAIDLIRSAGASDHVLCLISGGASSVAERPGPGISLDSLRTEIRNLMRSGAPIEAINRRRAELSAIKGGKLARMCEAPVVTLAISDVIGDSLETIGSGPTIAGRADDRARVIAPLYTLGFAMADALGGSLQAVCDGSPISGDVAGIASAMSRGLEQAAASFPPRFVSYGEPTIVVPSDHGEGGRMQQLALELAKRFRGRPWFALAVGSDGMDGPPPRDRPAPAGAYVDGMTWDAIRATGIDPQLALDRCDAGTALNAVGALVITGPTGVNHADLVVVG